MKVLMKLISILLLISGVLLLLLGVLLGGLFAAGNSMELVTLTVLLLGSSAVANIVSGVLGLRAAGNPAKATPAAVLGLLSLALAVIGLLADPGVQTACGCVLPLLYFICAMLIRNRSRQ